MYNETRRAAHCGAQQARDESRAADSEDLNVTKQKIGILGAGTWGMALARMLCVSGNDVLVWSAIEKEIDALSSTRVHPNLPGMKIPEELRFTKSVEEVCRDKDILLFAVPSVFVRSTAAKARPYVAEGQIIVDVAKGIEPDTLYTMTEVLADELGREGGPKKVHLVALSGPTHAEEVAIDLPTTIVSASPDVAAAQFVQEVFSNSVMRVYTNEDIKGVELSGAMKNVIALGVGISTGLGYGDNARAALITRGIAEIARLGVAMGCNVHTFAGLAGIGDLIVTATSMHSRNNRAGHPHRQGRDAGTGRQGSRHGGRGYERPARRAGTGGAVSGGNAHRADRERHRQRGHGRGGSRPHSDGPRPQERAAQGVREVNPQRKQRLLHSSFRHRKGGARSVERCGSLFVLQKNSKYLKYFTKITPERVVRRNGFWYTDLV